ncbi:MAG TPA: TRL-like family protein [Leptospiraceae bacterium]|nr:TRL-like family protein [Leptospiraceae bacterium]HMY65453.1 TRL-like family protein [Leptospiraceae bacterium]HMZ57711.1 TRL-like family protein [Leptospiraceae bacterium]HNF14307.1 TRL-like family protein [Leptospiraceae bacterium]HNF23547.1 TRL-like family protein [Leptospiraceae bacterium]
MKIKKIRLLFTLLLFLILTECGSIGETYRPAPGFLYSNVKFDGDFNPENNVPESKTAEGCIQHFLRIYSWGDSGAGSIANRAGIKKISFIDHKYTEFLLIYGKYCTVVYGE